MGKSLRFRRLQLEPLENRELLSLTGPTLPVQDGALGNDTPGNEPAVFAPIASPADAIVAGGQATGASQETSAVRPDLSGSWRGPLTETNPLGTQTFMVTLKIEAFPQWTPVFTGTMSQRNGSSSDFFGTVNQTGRVVINVRTQGIFMQFQLTGQLDSKNHMAGTLRIVDIYGGVTTGTFSFTRGKLSDVAATSLRWNAKAGGLTLRYDILRANLPANSPAEVALYWASGRTRNDAIRRIPTGSPIPSFAKMGSYTYNIPGRRLRNAPEGTTHILLVVDPNNKIPDADQRNNVFALQDVVVRYKPGVPKILSDKTVGIIKDALRYAGQKSGQINSTYRTPKEQADAMYTNLNKKDGVANQRNLYRGNIAANKVIDAYVKAVDTYKNEKDPETLKANVVSFIMAEFPADTKMPDGTDFWGNVSHHSGDFSKLQVVDISNNPKNGTTNPQLLHRAFASDSQWVGKTPGNKSGRIFKLIDPIIKPKAEPAFHIEVKQS